ncbi:P-loop NTPase fold protein [Rhizorhabdus argentea]|uniref:P-loop NTPase fold protein n=1 Tax=Rhizorhabdus argentea TaxID=1387174 RepID=UPI0030EF0B77
MTDALEIVDRLVVPPHDTAVAKSVLRWDIVEIIQRATHTRLRTGDAAKSLDLRHLLCGMMLTTAGHLGFSDAGLMAAGFDRLRRLTLAVIADALNGATPGHPEWHQVEDVIRNQRPLGIQIEARPDYASDRVSAGRDALDVGDDARALANLILLEAAEPPLAIGVFGAWGSGKSTLLAELRQEISRQTTEERDRIAAGTERREGELARVAGVIQVDFNAWTFADSDNLWASMTAELFDQIAAGGHDQKAARHGAHLVQEVAARTGRETQARLTAEAQLRASTSKIADAEAILSQNAKSRSTGAIDAAAQALLELVGHAADDAKPKDDEDKGKPEPVAHDALAPFRQIILSNNCVKPDAKVRAYIEAAGSITRFGLLFRDYAKSRASLFRWGLLGASMIITLLIIAWLRGSWSFTAPSIPRWLAGVGPALPMLLAAGNLLWPALRVLAVFNKTIRATKDRLAREKDEAETKLQQGRADKAAAEVALRESDRFLSRYSDIEDMASAPPALMLDYLLKESIDIAAIKGKMGFLGTVRRCFDQLNAVIDHARAADPNSPVQRIVIYLDDLDRCSERQVVQVLEAIHLLLAFPCFVVVAAVDARWLEHALSDQHRALAAAGHGVTPADYLEKIFQIPYWVRPIDDGSDTASRYRRYMASLLGDVSHQTRETDDDALDDIGGSGRTMRRVAPLKPGEREQILGRRLTLSREERELLLALGPLAAKSPRAVKRMVNLYRLIRVSISDWDAEEAREGQNLSVASCSAVQFILACDVGLPVATMTNLAEAIASINEDDWILFVGSVATAEPSSPNAVTAALAGGQNLARFNRALFAMIEVTGRMPDLSDVRLALGIVSQFSFRLNA